MASHAVYDVRLTLGAFEVAVTVTMLSLPPSHSLHHQAASRPSYSTPSNLFYFILYPPALKLTAASFILFGFAPLFVQAIASFPLDVHTPFSQLTPPS